MEHKYDMIVWKQCSDKYTA